MSVAPRDDGRLSPAESERLGELEQVVRTGVRTFVQVGSALMEIRDGRLHRGTHATFEEYCFGAWGLSQSRVYQLIDAAKIVDEIADKTSTIVELPANEAQVRPLAKLPAEQRRETWEEAKATAPKGKVTARHVQETVDRKMEKSPDKPTASSTGKSKVNGVVTDDPPDVAKARANGRIAKDVVPEVTEPVTPTEPEAPAEPSEGDLNDDAWIATLPLHSKLEGDCLKTFVKDALYYRRIEPARKTFQHHEARVPSSATQRGRYAYLTKTWLKTDHPKHWLRCPATENGGCGGTGQVLLIGQCRKCNGKGYWIK